MKMQWTEWTAFRTILLQWKPIIHLATICKWKSSQTGLLHKLSLKIRCAKLKVWCSLTSGCRRKQKRVASLLVMQAHTRGHDRHAYGLCRLVVAKDRGSKNSGDTLVLPHMCVCVCVRCVSVTCECAWVCAHTMSILQTPFMYAYTYSHVPLYPFSAQP